MIFRDQRVQLIIEMQDTDTVEMRMVAETQFNATKALIQALSHLAKP